MVRSLSPYPYLPVLQYILLVLRTACLYSCALMGSNMEIRNERREDRYNPASLFVFPPYNLIDKHFLVFYTSYRCSRQRSPQRINPLPSLTFICIFFSHTTLLRAIPNHIQKPPLCLFSLFTLSYLQIRKAAFPLDLHACR